jgi:hypothetical protein
MHADDLLRLTGRSWQAPAWSLRAELIYGLSAVDAVNSTHMMIQVPGLHVYVAVFLIVRALVHRGRHWRRGRRIVDRAGAVVSLLLLFRSTMLDFGNKNGRRCCIPFTSKFP